MLTQQNFTQFFYQRAAPKLIKIKENQIESETLRTENRQSYLLQQPYQCICKKAAKQLNALKGLGSFLDISQRKVLTESFITTNSNYCPVVWHLCSAKDKKKIERMQECTLRFATQIAVHRTLNFWTKRKPALWN